MQWLRSKPLDINELDEVANFVATSRAAEDMEDADEDLDAAADVDREMPDVPEQRRRVRAMPRRRSARATASSPMDTNGTGGVG